MPSFITIDSGVHKFVRDGYTHIHTHSTVTYIYWELREISAIFSSRVCGDEFNEVKRDVLQTENMVG
jgi:hypothetical protein